MAHKADEIIDHSRRPQLPCSVNYGSYPGYRIAAGTWVRIRKRVLPSEWRDHRTARDLVFDKAKTGKSGMFFEEGEWTIWAPREKVKPR